MSYINWKNEEDSLLEKMATSNNYSYSEIGKILNRSKSSCQSRANRLNIKNKHNRKTAQKYTVNEYFWSEITPTTCYWAGFSAADASIQETTPGYYQYSLELKSDDKSHVLHLKKLCEFTGKVALVSRKNKKNATCKMRIHSRKWANDLKENFGITPKKVTTIMPPKITDNKLLTLWLIGYTDGDGCVSYSKTNKIPYISYCSCNKELIVWIKDYFSDFGNQLKLKSSTIKNNNNRYFTFSIGGLKAAQFIDYVNNLGIYCLVRKWQNPDVIKGVSFYKEKYPHLFVNTHTID